MNKTEKILKDIKSGKIDSFYKETAKGYKTMLLKIYHDEFLIEEIINDAFLRLSKYYSKFTSNSYGELINFQKKIVMHQFYNKLKNETKCINKGKLVNKPRTILFGTTNYGEEKEEVFTNDAATIDLLELTTIHVDNEIITLVRTQSEILLSPNYHKALQLHLDGYKHAEIAEKMHCSLGTSKWKISECKRILHKYKKQFI